MEFSISFPVCCALSLRPQTSEDRSTSRNDFGVRNRYNCRTVLSCNYKYPKSENPPTQELSNGSSGIAWENQNFLCTTPSHPPNPTPSQRKGEERMKKIEVKSFLNFKISQHRQSDQDYSYYFYFLLPVLIAYDLWNSKGFMVRMEKYWPTLALWRGQGC